MTRWRRLGRVGTDGISGMLPTPILLDDKTIRVYLGTVDSSTISRITFVDVDVLDPTHTIRCGDRPVLDIGEAGMFDDNGVAPGCALVVGHEIWLYYIGFQLGRRARFSIFTGLAISSDGGETFTRAHRVPVLDRTNRDSLFRSTPCVVRDESGFRAWYAGGGEWRIHNNKALAVSEIRHVRSADGHRWPGPEDTCITLSQAGHGHALVRPWVSRTPAGYELLYCIRSDSGYRLASAGSADGSSFVSTGLPNGLDPVPGSWDQEMSYPALIDTAGRRYLFYSGNHWGGSGFGVAVLEET